MQRNNLVAALLSMVALAGCAGGSGGGPGAGGGGGGGLGVVNDKPYPTKPFIATYEFVMPSMPTSTQKWYTDGKGKMRIEMDQPGTGKVVTIMDYVNKKGVSILEAQKMAINIPMGDTENKSGYVNSYTAKQKGFQDLGKKNVKGHDCQGWKVPAAQGGGESTTWVDEGNGLLVETVMPMPTGESRMTLTDVKMEEPASSVFEVPAGYTVQNIPTQTTTTQ